MPALDELLNFTTPGSPRSLSRAIEECAAGQGSLSAIIVPWESDQNTVIMAITSTQGEGRFLEHTDLGTVRLTDTGEGSTRVEVLCRPQGHADKHKLAALFTRFASQIQTRFQVAP